MSFLRDTFAASADLAGQMSKDQLRQALQRVGLAPTLAQIEKVSSAGIQGSLVEK